MWTLVLVLVFQVGHFQFEHSGVNWSNVIFVQHRFVWNEIWIHNCFVQNYSMATVIFSQNSSDWERHFAFLIKTSAIPSHLPHKFRMYVWILLMLSMNHNYVKIISKRTWCRNERNGKTEKTKNILPALSLHMFNGSNHFSVLWCESVVFGFDTECATLQRGTKRCMRTNTQT